MCAIRLCGADGCVLDVIVEAWAVHAQAMQCGAAVANAVLVSVSCFRVWVKYVVGSVYDVYTVTNTICPSLSLPRLSVLGSTHVVGPCGRALVSRVLALRPAIAAVVSGVNKVPMRPTITPFIFLVFSINPGWACSSLGGWDGIWWRGQCPGSSVGVK